MRIKLSYMTPLIGAAAAAAAIAAAPIAAAAPTHAHGPSQGPSQVQQSCANLGGTQTECQSPGNAQVYDAPPQVDYFPYGGGAS